MSVLFVQNDFTHGEFSPKAYSRFDIVLYSKGAQKLRNVLVISQGGAKRRFGSKFVVDLGFTTDDFKTVEFEFEEDISYLFIFDNLRLKIYRDDLLVANLVTTYTAAEVKDLKFAQTTNLMLIAHRDHQPAQISRGASDASWSLSNFDIKVFPPHDFTKNYFNDKFTLSGISIGTPRNLTRTTGTFNFTSDYIGGVFIAAGPDITNPIGFARIISITGPTVAIVDIKSPFSRTINDGEDVIIAEPAWSASRGWPVTVSFYQDRLVFGGSRSLPQTLFMSKTGDFNSFDISNGQADDAIVEQIATNKPNNIKHLIADRTLQIYCSNAEFAPPQLEDTAMTPGEISIRKQTNNGSTNVEPVVLDNQSFYVKRGGRGVMSFVFDFQAQSYQSEEISILSEHLIDQPVDSGVWRGTRRDDADYLFIVNSDGTIAVYQSRTNQNISAWTLISTEGLYKDVVQVGDDVYSIVKRTINSVDKYYLEKFDFALFTDSSFTNTFGTPTTVITGLSHLEGETVRVRGDGFVLESETVAGAQITLERAVTEVEVGLNFNTLIEPLPVVIQASDGPTAYIPKRTVRIFVDYLDSLGVFVQNVPIPFESFGPTVLDQVPIPQSSIEEYHDLGWARRPLVRIEQFDPLPMTIRGIGYEVEI